MTTKISEGAVVRLLRNVERFPEFICDAGAIGTVVESESDFLRVKMDQHIPGAEEWDNCIIWVHPEDGEIDGDLEVVSVKGGVMNEQQQQEALNLLAESAQRFGNHCQGGLSKDTARILLGKIYKFMGKVEDSTGMSNIPEVG